jgi:hypothetical protein
MPAVSRGSFFVALGWLWNRTAKSDPENGAETPLCVVKHSPKLVQHADFAVAKLTLHSANESASSLACLIAYANSLRAICRRIASTACVPSQAPFSQVSPKRKLEKIGLQGEYPPNPLMP